MYTKVTSENFRYVTLWLFVLLNYKKIEVYDMNIHTHICVFVYKT